MSSRDSGWPSLRRLLESRESLIRPTVQMAYFAFFGVTILLALLGGLFSRVAAERYWM
ncbi:MULTISPECIES: hypothetical protein [unclassified Synechococcus]|uniref:hypothetical protein n=1 Tax=unclassified Synechococcus TaxID=2626047 RepID=UPI0014828CEE|nr:MULTISPECIES: hypothetical protein [unclassified Synechococcus]